jgi:hypothetical protein
MLPPRARAPHRLGRAGYTVAVAALASAALAACAPRATAPPSARFAAAEDAFARVRALRDRIDVTEARGAKADVDGTPLAVLDRRYAATRDTLVRLLAAAAGDDAHGAGTVADEGRRALAMMRVALGRDLTPRLPDEGGAGDRPPCEYDAAALAAGPGGRVALAARIYDCYGRAARHVEVDGRVLDRLTILGLLGRTTGVPERRRLFEALAPVWRSVNGDGGASSPYRQLARLTAQAWRAEGSPSARRARDVGIPPDSLEPWLLRILERWRAVTPDSALEPWDYHFAAGAASRALSPRIPRERLLEINERFYAGLGASPLALGVRYDLDPRDGKTPVAFTTFGTRGRGDRGQWSPPEAWVFATYRDGGLDNLSELLHETGHAVHIAAIATRPAFLDWPDSDPYSEALGDLAAFEIYEPAWQRRFLGDTVPLADALRAKYGAIVLDVAWALFEVRMHDDPTRDPNAVWTDLTSRYLRIRPHPEWSWWAMRGQLVDAPGYMMNYAIGAIVVGDLRARVAQLRGPLASDGAGWYRWVAARLYRHGLARPTREVVADFLGRGPTPDALLADLARAMSPPAR